MRQEIAAKHAAAFAFEVINKAGKLDTEDNGDNVKEKETKPGPRAPVASDPLGNTILDISKTVGREKEVKQILDGLALEDKKVFIVNGLAGIGKSILVSKLLQHEANPYPRGDYLIIDCRTHKTVADIFGRFSRLFEYHKNDALIRLLETDSREEDTDKLSQQVVTHLGKWLLVFDNFEELLQKSSRSEDDEMGEDGVPIEDIRLQTFFDYLFTLRHDAKAIITTRFIPRLPDYQNHICYPLMDGINEKLTGLSPKELREYAPIQGQSFTGEEWKLIDRKIDGHPQAFAFLCSLLGPKRRLSAVELLESSRVTRYKDKIKNKLLGKLLETLDREKRELLDTVCLLRKPFTIETVEHLLQSRDLNPVTLEDWLLRLDEKSLLEPNINRTWTMHAVVRDGVSAALPPDEKDLLHCIAAEYYVDTAPSKIKKLEDAEALEEAYYHYKEAQMEEKAEEVSNRLDAGLHRIDFANYMKSKWEDSARALEKRIKRNEEDWRLYFYLGNILLKQRKPIDEISFNFEKALKYSRNDSTGKAKILQSFGVALKTYQKHDAALEKFERSLKIEPQNAMTLQAYGIALKEARKYEKDEMDIQAKTEYARTLISLASQQEDKERSNIYFAKARSFLLEITPKDEVIYTELARMEGLAGNHDEKIKILTKALDTYPNNLFLLQESGNTYKTGYASPWSASVSTEKMASSRISSMNRRSSLLSFLGSLVSIIFWITSKNWSFLSG
jgi:tetratricopeptide (TPR) repeat protein